MTPPVSGGVPEQGLRETLATIARRANVGPPAPPNPKRQPCGWYNLVIELGRIARAALERPRPALPPNALELVVTLDCEPGSTNDMVRRELGAILLDNLEGARHIAGYRINEVGHG